MAFVLMPYDFFGPTNGRRGTFFALFSIFGEAWHLRQTFREVRRIQYFLHQYFHDVDAGTPRGILRGSDEDGRSTWNVL